MNQKDFYCPHCGNTVPAKANSCPHCGSDEHTGWSEQTYLDGIDLPEDDFIEILKKDYGVDLNKGPRIQQHSIAAIATLMSILFLLFYIIRC
ncbi:zinc-ribbon domain-containing protein [bacterium]|nr:zinc-ribbon domain-containing protein [bacterium]